MREGFFMTCAYGRGRVGGRMEGSTALCRWDGTTGKKCAYENVGFASIKVGISCIRSILFECLPICNPSSTLKPLIIRAEHANCRPEPRSISLPFVSFFALTSANPIRQSRLPAVSTSSMLHVHFFADRMDDTTTLFLYTTASCKVVTTELKVRSRDSTPL